MAKTKEIRATRDHYILKFNDGDPEKWRVGNLSRFLRNLCNDNPILRELNPKDKTAQQFALRMAMKMNSGLTRNMKAFGSNEANFYLTPPGSARKLRDFYSGVIIRMQPTHFKGLQLTSSEE